MKRPEPWAVSKDGKTGLYTISEIKALWKDRCEIVHENAMLHARIDRLERRSGGHYEESFEWMNL